MRTGPAGVHDSLGDALVVEVRNFFAQYEIFEQRGSSRAGLERILIIRNRRALVRRQAFAVSRLVRFSYGGMNENFVLVAGRSRWQADGV